jgi:uncharacterized protein (UPF0333 family)
MLSKRGQNTAEYAVLLALVIGAAVGIQTYVKRGVQGRLHDASKQYTDELNTGANATEWTALKSTALAAPTLVPQYEPTYINSKSSRVTTKDKVDSVMAKGGKLTRTFDSDIAQAGGDYQETTYTP